MVIKSFSFFNGVIILILLTAVVLSENLSNVNNKIQDDTYMYMGVQIYETERECAMLGGLCVRKSDCLQTTSKGGLCPKNQPYGVECCYELPERRAPCSHLGMCTSTCSKFLQRPATDCPQNQVCCVLI